MAERESEKWELAESEDLLIKYNANIVWIDDKVRPGWTLIWTHGTINLGGQYHRHAEYRIIASLFIFLWKKEIDPGTALDIAVTWGKGQFI